MKNILARVPNLIARAWVWSLLLICSIGLMIWFLGPGLAFDNLRPWAEVTSRLTTLCVLALSWGMFVVFHSARKARHESLAMNHADDASREAGTHAAAANALRESFRKGLRTLSQAKVYRGRNERWRKALPWYLLLGPHGSGKTSLIEYSGLNLPLNERDDRAFEAPTSTADFG
jgi:type VI secretion system protein ImpL